MLVRLTIKNEKGELTTITKEVVDGFICPIQDGEMFVPDEDDLYTRVAKSCGWTEHQRQKIDNPLWFLSTKRITKIEKL